MRSLRKIIFINSAHIRYQEVNLDGNVHFIGTQGVGKSTLLRAILFFYNADKQQLGIPKEMKSFDEFYLPNSNSYMIYEVEHEHGPFSILVFRSSGRACYRFIDAPFQKDWIINEHGEATAEYKTIRERLGKQVSMSKIIDRYEQYRDILYGNAKEKEMSRFRLMETKNYDNIPRSIQNVFLNSRLDADFIKDIIIRSMSEEEANIDLGYYRRQVSDFEQEFRDISCWYNVDQKGISPVKKQANAVIDSYHNLSYLRKRIKDLCKELKYAMRTAEEKKPLIEQELEVYNSRKEQQIKLLAENQEKYEKELYTLNREIGGIDKDLKTCKDRRNYYKSIQIDTIIRRCEKESVLSDEKNSHEDKLRILTSQYEDITTRFKKLIERIEQQIEDYKRLQQSNIQKLNEERQKSDENSFREYEKQKNEIDVLFNEKIKSVNEILLELNQTKNDYKTELIKLDYLEPRKDDINILKENIQNFETRNNTLTIEIETITAQIDKEQANYEKEEAGILNQYEQSINAKSAEIDLVKNKISELDTLLGQSKGSLYEWLEDNIQNWEQNIGKVIDEEHILYTRGLNPQKVDNSYSLYGVKLELSELPMNVRKPAELKKEKEEKEVELQALKHALTELNSEKEKEIKKLNTSYSSAIQKLKQQKAERIIEKGTIPNQLKSIKVQLQETEQDAQNIIEKEKQRIQSKIEENANQISLKTNENEKLESDKKKRHKTAKETYEASKTSAKQNFEEKAALIRKDISENEYKANQEIKELKQKETKDLKDNGADTIAIKACNNYIKEINQELEFISNNKKHVYNYERDKEDYFDKEPNFILQKKQLNERLNDLKAKYANKKQQYEEKLKNISALISDNIEQLKQIKEDLNKGYNFINDPALCPTYYQDIEEKTSISSPTLAVEKITSSIINQNNQLNSFKQNVNSFISFFSKKNTFNFRKEFSIEDDYYDFAANLDEFILNNKLEEYRRRTSERYVDILSRLSKEMGELTRNVSEVEKLIQDINNDFKGKNFVQVIKLIAMQSVPSSDKMVQLMTRIKSFNDEHQHTMGEMNLFSTENREEVNQKAVEYLLDFMKSLQQSPSRMFLKLSDLFQLQFRVIENDNDTKWVNKLSHVGSEGTDTLVKAMVNIMLINVFKEKVSKKFGEFKVHCMMDEIGKLHPQNVKGILAFANSRNIMLINSSPTTYNVSDYKYTYLLSKDGRSNTVINALIAQK